MTSAPVQRTSDDASRSSEERLAARKKAQKKPVPPDAEAAEPPPEPVSTRVPDPDSDLGTDADEEHKLDLMA